MDRSRKTARALDERGLDSMNGLATFMSGRTKQRREPVMNERGQSHYAAGSQRDSI